MLLEGDYCSGNQINLLWECVTSTRCSGSSSTILARYQRWSTEYFAAAVTPFAHFFFPDSSATVGLDLIVSFNVLIRLVTMVTDRCHNTQDNIGN